MNQSHHEITKPSWRGAVILSLELPCSASASASSNDATFERVVVTDSNTPPTPFSPTSGQKAVRIRIVNFP